MNNLFKNTSEDKSAGKRAYESPEIKVLSVELEHSIAAGSAVTNPQNLDGQIMEEWELDEDETHTFEW